MAKFAVVKNNIIENIVLGEPDGIEMLIGVFLPGADEVVEITDSKGLAFIGGKYKDGKFQSPPPYQSWIFDEETWSYSPPIEMPTDEGPYEWNETDGSWQLVTEFEPTE